MFTAQDLLDLCRTDIGEAEYILAQKWAGERVETELSRQIVQDFSESIKAGLLTITDASLILTYALAGCTCHRSLQRAITVTSLPPTPNSSLSVYADYVSPFEKTPTTSTPAAPTNTDPSAGAEARTHDAALIATASFLVDIIETCYLASAEQAESHRAALARTVQGLQVLSGLLRSYAMALVEVLRVPNAGDRCVGFLQRATVGLAHRPTALSVAHATLVHVARQTGQPAAALRLIRPVLARHASAQSLPVILDVESRATGLILADFAAFYVEASLFCAAHGQFAEATACVYNVVSLHEGECFGSNWNGTALNIRMPAGTAKSGGFGGAMPYDEEDRGSDEDFTASTFNRARAQRPVHNATLAEAESRAAMVGTALPERTRQHTIGLRPVGAASPFSHHPLSSHFVPSKVEVCLAYDLYLQAVKLCFVLVIIAYGGGQPERALSLLNDLSAAARHGHGSSRAAKSNTEARRVGVAKEAVNTTNADVGASAAGRGGKLSSAGLTEPGDLEQGEFAAAENLDFARSHMKIDRIILAGTRLDTFTGSHFSRRDDEGERRELVHLKEFPASAALMTALAPFHALLRCAVRRDLVEWMLLSRQYDSQLASEPAIAALLPTAAAALRRHVVADLARTYEAVYLREIVLRTTPHVSDVPGGGGGGGEAAVNPHDINEAESAIQLLCEMHEEGQVVVRIERTEEAIASRRPGDFIVRLSVPSLNLPGRAGGVPPPHAYFCLAPALEVVDFTPALVERNDYLHDLRQHLAHVKAVDYARWYDANTQ